MTVSPFSCELAPILQLSRMRSRDHRTGWSRAGKADKNKGEKGRREKAKGEEIRKVSQDFPFAVSLFDLFPLPVLRSVYLWRSPH